MTDDPYQLLVEEAEEFDFDAEEEMVGSLADTLSKNELSAYASDLGILEHGASKMEIAEALADAGCFYGGVGDDHAYIRTDGETHNLEEYTETGGTRETYTVGVSAMQSLSVDATSEEEAIERLNEKMEALDLGDLHSLTMSYFETPERQMSQGEARELGIDK